ncbi:MAG: GNAT family N-acetyltransferase [Pseudomonadota bacterium]
MPEIEDLRPAHLPQAFSLARGELWPHRMEDWQMMLSLGSGHALIHKGNVIGTVLVWWQGARQTTLGMVLVHRDHRGRGHGRRLVEAALAPMADHHIMLQATDDGLALYYACGFRAIGSIRQCQGVPTQRFSTPDEITPEPFDPSDLDALIVYDGRARGWTRRALLTELTVRGSAWVVRDGATFLGYAVARRFGHGVVIGPIAAQDGTIARALIARIAEDHPKTFLRIDTDPDLGLVPWLADHGLIPVGEAATMVKGSAVAAGPGDPRLFGLASQALL